MRISRQFKLEQCLFPVIAIFLSIRAASAAPVPIDTSTLSRPVTDETKYGLGFSVSVAQRPFVGVDQQNTSLPYIKFSYKDLYIEGTNFGYKFLDSENTRFEVLATPRFYEVKPSFAENGELDGIDETSPTYLAGLSLQHTEVLTFTTQLLFDVIESDGYEFILSASKNYKISKSLFLAPAFGITYQDSKLVDHFYGVQANEVAAGRPEYQAGSSVNTNVSLTALWDATRHIQLLGQVKYEKLGDGITDSPIVDEDSIATAVLGVVYIF
jgi:outer membrane protein